MGRDERLARGGSRRYPAGSDGPIRCPLLPGRPRRLRGHARRHPGERRYVGGGGSRPLSGGLRAPDHAALQRGLERADRDDLDRRRRLDHHRRGGEQLQAAPRRPDLVDRSELSDRRYLAPLRARERPLPAHHARGPRRVDLRAAVVRREPAPDVPGRLHARRAEPLRRQRLVRRRLLERRRGDGRRRRGRDDPGGPRHRGRERRRPHRGVHARRRSGRRRRQRGRVPRVPDRPAEARVRRTVANAARRGAHRDHGLVARRARLDLRRPPPCGHVRSRRRALA